MTEIQPAKRRLVMTKTIPVPTRRLCAVAVLMLLLATTVMGCGKDDPAPQALPTIRFAFIPSVDYLSYLVIVDQGFDRANGFTLTETAAVGGRAALDALAADEIDATIAGSTQVFVDARAGLVPDKIVAVAANTRADPDHPAMAMVVGAGIDGWRDLDGAAISTNQIGSLGEVAGRLRLQQEGVTGFTFVEIALPDQGLAVADGTVSAAIMTEPYRTQSMRRGDGRVLDWVIGGEPFPTFPYAFVVMRGDFTREEPELVRSYLRAHLDAVKWIEAHEDEARDLLARRLNLEPAVAEDMLLNPFVGDGRFDRPLLERVQATIAAADPAATPVAADDLVDEHFLLEVLEEPAGG